MTTRIVLAGSEAEVAACFPVVQQLRPHLDAGEFTARVRRQEQEGYRLAFVEADGRPVAVAGFRILETLVDGRVLHVDDLVTDAAHRSEGHGAALLAWLSERAREASCETLQLDSGVQRRDAHRFYEREGMRHVSHHFKLRLDPPPEV